MGRPHFLQVCVIGQEGSIALKISEATFSFPIATEKRNNSAQKKNCTPSVLGTPDAVPKLE